MRWILVTAAVASAAFADSALAQECAVVVEGNDQLQFLQKEITVSKSCESFTVTLKHVGTLDKAVMGHNWVLTKTADFMAVGQAGGTAGPANEYVPPDDPRVLAATIVIGGGEETTISFDPSILEAGGDYTFFCSFPPHYVVMNGKLIVK